MKIILSRKGFDASYGGFPSPVFENGKMISLPIPTIDKQEAYITYDDLNPLGVNLGSLFKKLGKEPKIYNKVAKYVHLYPDLYQDSLKPNNKFRARLDGWRGLFGTNMAAAGKLNNKDTGVNPEDIFLFFGWFNDVINKQGKFAFELNSNGFHQIWGWLQIDRIIHLDQDKDLKSVPNWAKYHPHCFHPEWKPNVLFVAKQKLSLEGYNTDGINGYGVITQFNELATLTEMDIQKNNYYYNEFQRQIGKTPSPNEDIKKSLWRMPLWFYHKDITKRLGYHNNDNEKTKARWNKDENYSYLRSTSPGQEFILDLQHYPECAKQWVLDIIKCGSKCS